MSEKLNRVLHLRESIDTGLSDEALSIIEAVLTGEYERCYDGTYRVSEVHVADNTSPTFPCDDCLIGDSRFCEVDVDCCPDRKEDR